MCSGTWSCSLRAYSIFVALVWFCSSILVFVFNSNSSRLSLFIFLPCIHFLLYTPLSFLLCVSSVLVNIYASCATAALALLLEEIQCLSRNLHRGDENSFKSQAECYNLPCLITGQLRQTDTVSVHNLMSLLFLRWSMEELVLISNRYITPASLYL